LHILFSTKLSFHENTGKMGWSDGYFFPPHFAPFGRIGETTPHALKKAHLLTREKSGCKRAFFPNAPLPFLLFMCVFENSRNMIGFVFGGVIFIIPIFMFLTYFSILSLIIIYR